MIRKALLASSALIAWSTAAMAQNTICATAPPGDSSNRCASTAFVHGAAPAFASGAACDGVTDDAATINSAISAANTAGGGIVVLPSGTCIVGSSVVPRSFVNLAGQGSTATTIKGKNGTTGAIIQTLNFASLTGTNACDGPFMWGLSDLAIDGNKANRASGDNLDLYGYQFNLTNLDIKNAPGQGIYSEWSTQGSVPLPCGTSGDMVAHLNNVRVYSNGSTGINWNGPHDSQFDQVFSFINSNVGMSFTTTATTSAVATTLHEVHVFGNTNWGIIANTQLFMQGVESESNTAGGGIQVNIPAAGSGGIIGSGIQVFQNTGVGMQLNIGGNVISDIWSHDNSTVGLQVGGNRNVLSGVFADANTTDGIQVLGDLNSMINFIANANGGNGVVVTNGSNQEKLIGISSGNTGTQLVLNTLGVQNHIDVNVIAGAHTSWSGTVGANDVHIVSDKTDGISPWKDPQAFTATPTCGTATFGTVVTTSNTVGKTTTINIDIPFSTIGTCTKPLTFTLPNTVNGVGAISGFDNNTGKGAYCLVAGTTGTCQIDDVTNFAAASRLIMSGVYRNQ
jgi:pectate lyase-like protein